MRIGLLALTLLVWSSCSALAAPLEINTHTAAAPEQSLKLAATWFLPDWQASTSSRTETAPAGSGDRHDLTCSTYGGCGSVPAHMSCSESFRVDGTTCYKSCTCKSGYVRVSSADICRGCVNPCDTVAAVPTPYGCQTYWSVCPSKCQIAYPDNCRNRTAVSTPYGCKTYFSDCSTKCQTAYSDNCHNRTAVDAPYGCEKTFDDCASKCETANADNCRNYSSKPLASSCANGCAQGKTYADCPSRCSVGCKARCDTGYHLSSDQLSCVADGCPSGYEAGKTCGAGYTLEKSGQSGTQYCGRCVVKPCAAGSTSCSGDTIAVANGYYSGDSKCYTCTAKTCEQMGQKTCNGSCIATSQCCGGCPSGQKCVNGSCIEKSCEDYDISYTPTLPSGSGSLVYDRVDSLLVNGLVCYAPRLKECRDFGVTYTPTLPSGTGSGLDCVRVDPQTVQGSFCYDCQQRDCPVGETDDMHISDCQFGLENPNTGWYKPDNYGTENNYRWCARCKQCPDGYEILGYEMAEGYLDKIFSKNYGVYCYRYYSNRPISCPAGYTYTLCGDVYCRVGTAMSKDLVLQVTGINTNACYRCKYSTDALSRPYHLFCNDISKYGPIN